MDQLMDEKVQHEDEIDQHPQQNEPAHQNNSESQPKEIQEIKVPRKPGRPPRQRGRQKDPNKIKSNENPDDQQFEGDKGKIKQKILVLKEENNVEGFVRIIDYLKKIQCDETALHNRMNPYNLLTPSCFWFLVSAQYFSYDFFNYGNPTEAAVQILKKAQRTHITLPQRIIKPVRSQNCLQFQTRSLREASKSATDKLINLIPNPPSILPEVTEKTNPVTSTTEDDLFRSSTRAMIFNYVKNKIKTNQRWANVLLPRIKLNEEIPKKDFKVPIIGLDDTKADLEESPPQMLYRQRRKDKEKSKKRLESRQKNMKQKLRMKKKNDDQIFDEESSISVKQEIEEPEKVKSEMIDQDQQNKEVIKNEENEDQERQLQHDDKMEEEIHEDEKGKQELQGAEKQIVDKNEDEMIDEKDEKERQQEFINCTKVYSDDDVLLDAIMHLPLDSIISILQSAINPVQLPEIQRPYLPIPKNDPLQFVYQIHPDEEKFMQYMKERQEKIYKEKNEKNEEMIEQKQRQVQVEDAKCQVCTDGDYTDDNLIVFCSMCNISLHQRCVGLAKVPADSWICEVCAAFGPAGINVPCPLCNVKGGALKRTSIHINSNIFKDTNISFHEYSKKCPFIKLKEEYVPKQKKDDDPYYDYFMKSTYPNDEPVCNYVWVHYVCAIWVPQCYFEQKNGQINIKGVQNIDKKRFKEKCLICDSVKGGACIKCDNQKCEKYYHPECARKKKVYMEQLNLDKLKYLIFCQAHEPLKVRRKIEVKRKKYRDEIVKFCRGIQKYVETYKIAHLPFRLLKSGLNHVIQNSKTQKKEKQLQIDQKIISPKLQKFTDEDFVNNVISNLSKKNTIVVNISKEGQGYKVDDVMLPSKRDLRKWLNRQDDFWKDVAKGESAQNNLKRFQTIIRQKNELKDKIESFINYGKVMSPKKQVQEKKVVRKGRRRKERETIIQEEGGTFCICRRPYQGEDDMIECEVCQEWYHHKCIGFIGNEEDAQNMDFHCMKCMKFESPEEKQIRIERIKKFFTQDSQFLLYRPPTPDLSSEFVRLEKIDEIQLEEEEKQKIQEDQNQDIQRESSIVTPQFYQIGHSSEKQTDKKVNKKQGMGQVCQNREQNNQ